MVGGGLSNGASEAGKSEGRQRQSAEKGGLGGEEMWVKEKKK